MKWVVIILGLLVGLIIVVPTFRPGVLIAGLGIGSVGIGFKDILQNWLTGLLLLIRQPFRVGDGIVMNVYEGQVDWIESRAAMIRTCDRRRAIVPNADLFTNPVTVNTAFSLPRTEVEVGIDYGDRTAGACNAISAALRDVEGDVAEPCPARPCQLVESQVTIKVRGCSDSRRSSVIHAQAQVMEAIKDALDGAGIDMLFPTQIVLLHDQIEEFEGRCGRQREGWPPAGTARSPARRASPPRRGWTNPPMPDRPQSTAKARAAWCSASRSADRVSAACARSSASAEDRRAAVLNRASSCATSMAKAFWSQSCTSSCPAPSRAIQRKASSSRSSTGKGST